jgi:hypothetical protein
MDHLPYRVKTTNNLLSFFRSKSRIMSMPGFAYTACGFKYEGVGFVDIIKG